MTLKVFEAFAGIGAQKRALENIGADYEIVGIAEWYIPAIIAYHAIHNNFKLNSLISDIPREDMIAYLASKPLSINSKELVNPSYFNKMSKDKLKIVYSAVKFSEEYGNIFDVSKLYERQLKGIDLLTYSFPCQDLSIQGKQKGIKKEFSTRSGLLWEIEKALDHAPKEELPKYLLMENVTAITNSRHMGELQIWIEKLESLGYISDLKLLNSGNFGSSQARKRAFMLSTLSNKIELPQGDAKPNNINRILNKQIRQEDILDRLSKYELSPFKAITKSNIKKTALMNYSNFDSESYVYDPDYTGPTLTASGANSRIKIIKDGQIRKLCSSECFKYMGFIGKDHMNIKKLNFLNDEKLIFLSGNSISIEVLEKIMEIIYDDFKQNSTINK